jgi:hypothetical protein
MARGQYGASVGEDRWWRRAPSGWQRSREEWERLPEQDQQAWWRYYQQYPQPYYPGWRWDAAAGRWVREHERQQYPGWRWVPGYGGAGRWERERTW